MAIKFDLQSDFGPSLDQKIAIDSLVQGVLNNYRYQTLHGITGSGKTFTMANMIQCLERPTLIMTHNKTLAAQLYGEFKNFFPNNAVEYFVSYYDYYQPEAYIARTDTFIEKDTSINDNLDKMRLSATRSLFEREDVIIISSVSCIYGLGSPDAYLGMMLYLTKGSEMERNDILAKLVAIQYSRNDYDFHRGTFRVRGNIIDIFPAYDDFAIRIEMYGTEIEEILEIDPLTGKKGTRLTKIAIYPASHYVNPADQMQLTLDMIRSELEVTLDDLRAKGKLLEAQRLEQRTRFDLEMLEETGSCSGVENYSRIMTRRKSGEPPPTLIDYFPKDSLLFLDESHATVPQINGMYHGDRSRKLNLIEHGFRLPSALDNRPLHFEEFELAIRQTIYVSATPAAHEIEMSGDRVIQQIFRPTGLLDPVIEVRPIEGQVDDMYSEIQIRVHRNERVMITTLTKRMAEDLAEYYEDLNLRVKYMHSDIVVIERTEIIKGFRKGDFDVLIGINLLREGLDIPEASLMGIFDADKEGFLRSERSLLQTIGRVSRNEQGLAIFYADQITDSMRKTIEITQNRRKLQKKYNEKHGIIPATIQKKMVESIIENSLIVAEPSPSYGEKPKDIPKKVEKLQKEMKKAAKNLDFEKAAELRDEMNYWKDVDLGIME